MAAILPTLPALPPFDFADAGADYGSIVQDGGLNFQVWLGARPESLRR